MPFALVGEVGGKAVRIELPEGSRVIGRSGDADIRLDDHSVSRRHASIVVSAGVVTVTDLGSLNGTRVDGAKIAAPTVVRPGAAIAFADATFALVSNGCEAGDEPALTGTAVVTSSVPLSELYGEARDPEARSKDLFRVLADAGQFLVSDRPLSQLCDAVLDLVERTVACQRVVILSVEKPGSDTTFLASRGRGAGRSGRGLALSRTMVRQVLDEGVSLLTADAQEDSRFSGSESVISQGIHAAMAAPLYDNSRIIGLLYADTTDPATRYGADELRTFTALANLVAVKITQARLAEIEEEKKRLDRELATAREIIGNILPAGVTGTEGYEVALAYEPCSEVGGDLYDVRHLDDGRTVIMAGDVAGKGLGAAILVSSIVPVAQVLVGGAPALVQAVETLNRRVCACTDAVRYATLFVGVLERASGRLEYVNAGHNPPLIVSANGDTRRLTATAMPVGMLETAPFASAEVVLEPGASLVVFSDGITEALGPDGSFYEDERLAGVMKACRSLPAGSTVKALLDDLVCFTRGTPQSDDITLLVARRT